jgi:hypothetical protein
MKKIIFSQHSMDQLKDRGTNKNEVKITIIEGEKCPAKYGRKAFRKNFLFNDYWKGKFYKMKQVMPIVKEMTNKIIVITVYVFYFGGEE